MTAMSRPTLVNARILLVEDEFMIAMLLEETLEEAGAVVVGPFATLAEALQAAGDERFDIALLDVNLAGEKVYPLAECLDERHVPFLLLTGYGSSALPLACSHWPVQSKPFRPDEVLDRLVGLLPSA